MNTGDTIVALATAPVAAGVGVIRISGKLSGSILEKISTAGGRAIKDPNKLTYTKFIDLRDNTEIDSGLIVYMKAPKSFTGEDTAELHFHGSPLIAQKLVRLAVEHGATPAQPGEFSYRAFLNGKIDLVQAESIAEIINATSEEALRIANAQFSGVLSKAINKVGEPLRDILSEIEAHIDFPEEDIKPQTHQKILQMLRATQITLNGLMSTFSYGQLIKDGFKVLIAGRPNAGKSSLLNVMLDKEKAIVTNIPGTTRDLIEDQINIEGFKFIFCDSAGIVDTEDVVERIGIEKAKERIKWADLILLVVDAGSENQNWIELRDILSPPNSKKLWLIVNKIDKNPSAITSIFCDSEYCSRNFYLSAQTGAGLSSLKEALVDEIRSHSINSGEISTLITNERHRHCIKNALISIERAVNGMESALPFEFIAADIRSALKHLEEIIGRTYNEEILDRIFSKFCIGK